MRAKTLVLAAVFLSVTGGIGARGQEAKAQQAEKEKKPPSYIRKDLLQKEEPPLEVPRRNVFARGRYRAEEFEPGSSGKVPGSLETPPSLPGSGASPGFVYEVRYLGYIQSGEKLVALISFEGESLAVESGDVIAAGVKIGTITTEIIEILGSDNQTRKYFLEEEGS